MCYHFLIENGGIYSTLGHTNQAYDVSLDRRSAGSRASHAGSGVMYVYNGGAGEVFIKIEPDL